ncbi:MAG: molybdate ABC transporter substrate-binding protein [Xanthomonadales bacterium]|nr:molybdate ABC transporter substrate-binding protein [Xanthomonadales bacterium]
MTPRVSYFIFCSLLIFSSLPGTLEAAEIRVAVASNFVVTMKLLARSFETQNNHRIVIASGSTGKHFAQISHGAPFDLFFAADAKRPQLLEQQGLAIDGTRFTYALGTLTLWQPEQTTNRSDNSTGMRETTSIESNSILKTLKQANFNYLAIANPKLAPYGMAAKESLQALGLWEKLQTQIVRGENISQAFHFVYSGNAQLGFVAHAQLIHLDPDARGGFWQIPPHYYQPIEQQAVQLNDKAATRAFVEYIRSPAAKLIIQQQGYLTSDTLGR